ncbi:MAG: amidohydrolase family protein [bacterium]
MLIFSRKSRRLQFSRKTVTETQPSFGLASTKPAEIFGLNAGRIAEGNSADLMLVDRQAPSMALADVHDTKSHLSYALTPDTIKTVLCDGDILKHNGSTTDDRETIIERFKTIARDLCY